MTSDWKRSVAIGFGTLLIALVCSSIITWPLARYASTGIPSSHTPELGGAREMIAGDHLQLLYFFQLAADFIRGETPWFHNLYEFNEGVDADRFVPDFYYMPFSAIYALGSFAGGSAFGWNLTGLLSLWLTLLGTLLLIRRYCRDSFIQWGISTVVTLFPYRLATFLHGSPTGFGMAYVPFFLLGLDWAIRNGRMRGGAMAGLVFLLSGWADMHVFFFLALLAPFWCVWLYLYDGWSLSMQRFRSIVSGMLPFVGFAVLVLLQAWFVRQGLEDTAMSGGRTIDEVRLFSPVWQSYLFRGALDPYSYVYLTWTIFLSMVLGAVILFRRLVAQKEADRRRKDLLFCGLLVGVLGVLLLALGPRMPVYAAEVWWERLGRVVPPYRMIRQPAKILVLLPSLVAVFMAGALTIIHAKRLRWVRMVSGIAVACMVLEVGLRVEPTISLLDREQAAYQAVVDNAALHGEDPRALAIVLWPGDTHWSSLYQYYGMMYRIRMLNGYSPNVSQRYIDDVFYRFISLNRGYASDAQLDALLDMGIRHLLLHEDAFPERVSPFGVAQTLQLFLAHDRLRYLTQDRSVWAFEIRETADSANEKVVDWDTASITYRWDATRIALSADIATHADPNRGGAPFLRLAAPNQGIKIPDWGMHDLDGLRVSARLRGKGVLQRSMRIEEEIVQASYPVESTDWTWFDIPYSSFSGFSTNLSFTLALQEGQIDVDQVYIAKGRVPDALEVGDTFAIPAPTLFRAGYTDLAANSVMLRPESVPANVVLYGPRLPLPIGSYAVRLVYRADDDVSLGSIRFREDAAAGNTHEVEVYGGQTVAEILFHQTAFLPMTLAYEYNRAASIEVKRMEIERLD